MQGYSVRAERYQRAATSTNRYSAIPKGVWRVKFVDVTYRILTTYSARSNRPMGKYLPAHLFSYLWRRPGQKVGLRDH